jgi:hypothetical protein
MEALFNARSLSVLAAESKRPLRYPLPLSPAHPPLRWGQCYAGTYTGAIHGECFGGFFARRALVAAVA